MTYSLIVDYREHCLKKYFDNYSFNDDKNLKNIEYKVENLDLGDIIIKKDNKVILIIERKTLQDLYSSINDGRYKEQKIRLKNNYNDFQILYIIEDCNVKFVKNKFSNFDSIINGAIINSIFRDNIKLLRTKNVEDTIIYIKTLLKKVQNNLEFFEKDSNNSEDNAKNNTEDSNLKIISINSVNSNISNNNYVENVKIKKKENKTPKNCNIIMLCQIPGVSVKISQIILNEYKSLSNLIMEYNKLTNEKNKETLLKDISYSISNNKTRKIGPVISNKIYKYLFSLE